MDLEVLTRFAIGITFGVAATLATLPLTPFGLAYAYIIRKTKDSCLD